MEKYSVVKGKTVKTAISELICLLSQKNISGKTLENIFSEFKNLYVLFSDDIFYPARIYDLLQEGKENITKNDDVSNLWRDLHHGCVYGIHYELASSEDFVSKQVNSAIYNSESFYNKKIDAIDGEKNALIQEINDLKKKLNQAQKTNLFT